MAQAERMLLDGFDVRQGATETEVDPLSAGRGVGADDGEGQGLVPAGLDLGDGRLRHAQTLGDIRLRELSTPAEACEPVGDAGVLRHLGVRLLDLIPESFSFDQFLDGSIGPRGGLGRRAVARRAHGWWGGSRERTKSRAHRRSAAWEFLFPTVIMCKTRFSSAGKT